MSEKNVELVREGYAAWERGDIELIIEGTHPEIVIVQPPEVPDSKSYRGKAGVRQAFADWQSEQSRTDQPTLRFREMPGEKVRGPLNSCLEPLPILR